MKLSDVSWKNMHPAGLMQDVAKELGTEDPNEFLRIYRTNPDHLYRIPGMGRATIRDAVATMKDAGLDVEGTAFLEKILEFLRENSERSSFTALIGVMKNLLRSGAGDDPKVVVGLFEAALLAWGEGSYDDEHISVRNIGMDADRSGVISGDIFYRDDKIASAIATAEGMEVTKTISS